MFQKSSHKAVMHALCSGTEFEYLGKFFVAEIHIQHTIEIRILHRIHKAHKLSVHFLDIVGRYRQIIRGIIFSFVHPAHTLDIQLQCSGKGYDISHYLHVIHIVKIIDTVGIGIPDFSVQHSRFILQDHIVVGFSVLGHGRLSVFAQIDTGDTLPVPEIFDIFHRLFLFSLSSLHYNTNHGFTQTMIQKHRLFCK